MVFVVSQENQRFDEPHTVGYITSCYLIQTIVRQCIFFSVQEHL